MTLRCNSILILSITVDGLMAETRGECACTLLAFIIVYRVFQSKDISTVLGKTSLIFVVTNIMLPRYQNGKI